MTAGFAPLVAPAPAGAVTIGDPRNATARADDEDEPAVAVNPSNTQQVAVLTNGPDPNHGLRLSISSDGGQSWTRSLFGTGTGQGGDGRPQACCDPTLSWDDHGNLFVGYLKSEAPESVQLFVTTDLGATFTDVGPVSAGEVDQPTVVAGADSVWVTWSAGADGVIARGRPVTGPATFGPWGDQVSVAPHGNFGDIAIGPTGGVLVAYQDPFDTEGASTISVALDVDGLGPQPFEPPVAATTTNVGGFDTVPAQPARQIDAEAGLAWDRSGGAHDNRIYLVYTDEEPDESNDTNIFVRTSDDDGQNWSAPARVNDDTGTNTQMMPRIALDQTNGDVAVTFYDARGDTGGGPSVTDIDGTANNDVTYFGSWSLDGGATWAANVAIADAPTNGYALNDDVNLGDYTGAAFHGGTLYPAWTDGSNSTGDNPDGARTTLDVYVAAVRPRDGGGGPTPPTVSVGDASGNEGAAIEIPGSAGGADGVSWSVTPIAGDDPGAECILVSGADTVTPTIRCSDDGTYTATLTASGSGGTASASGTVTVRNVAPVVTGATVIPSTIDEGQTTAFRASFSDPGWNDTYSASVDWGFGPPEGAAADVTTQGSAGVPDAGTVSASHTYMDDGSFTATGSVSDDDGGSDAGSAVLRAENVDPTAAIDESGAVPVNGIPTIITHAGTPVPFSGRSTDPGSDDLTLTWDWDDGPPAPDVSTVSLHAPPNPDPDPSPDGHARDETDNQVHTFTRACLYDVVFASADDDGGHGSDDIVVVVVGNFVHTKSHGYFKTEFRRLKDHTAEEMQCLLDITGHMSRVFSEVTGASTPDAAVDVFDTSHSSSAGDLFDAQLLAAWMNFADGRVALDDLVDSNGDHTPGTTFGDLITHAENVRLDPQSTRAEILAQKDLLEAVNTSGM